MNDDAHDIRHDSDPQDDLQVQDENADKVRGGSTHHVRPDWHCAACGTAHRPGQHIKKERK